MQTTSNHGAVVTIVRDFETFYRSEFRSVAGLGHALSGNLGIGEELAQEAFIAAYKRWGEIGSYDKPEAWVRRVVANRAISSGRRSATERRFLPWLRQPQQADLDVATVEILEAMGKLSARQAQAIALHYFSDLELTDVAQIMEMSVETVRTHLKRARIRLAEQLGESS